MNGSIPAADTQTPISRNRLLALSGLGWMFDAMDVGLLSFILAAGRGQFDWHGGGRHGVWDDGRPRGA